MRKADFAALLTPLPFNPATPAPAGGVPVARPGRLSRIAVLLATCITAFWLCIFYVPVMLGIVVTGIARAGLRRLRGMHAE